MHASNQLTPNCIQKLTSNERGKKEKKKEKKEATKEKSY